MSLRGAHVDHHLRGLHHGRLGARRVLIVFAVALGALIGVTAAIGAVAAPNTVAQCTSGTACGAPPSVSRPLVNETVWRSSQYGFSFEYPGAELSVAKQSPAGVILEGQLNDGSTVALSIAATPVGQGTPAQAIVSTLRNLNGVSQIAADTAPGDQLLGPAVGYRPGVGGAFVGDLAAPQGVGQPEAIASESAGDGTINITATVETATKDAGANGPIYGLVDSVVNSIVWPQDNSGG